MEEGTCDVRLTLDGSFAGKRNLLIEFNGYSSTGALALGWWKGRGHWKRIQPQYTADFQHISACIPETKFRIVNAKKLFGTSLGLSRIFHTL